MNQPNPRYALASARIALRAAQDSEATLKAIISGQAQGTNDTQRKASAAELLLHSDDYQDALRELRACEAQLDHAQAEVDIANDDLRRAELAARERLAEVLMGRRADEAIVDINSPFQRHLIEQGILIRRGDGTLEMPRGEDISF